jgi:predicted AlkP superfamily phosphohydrolase/phosphomutase
MTSRHKWAAAGLAFLLVLCALVVGSLSASSSSKRMLVLGIDALDPQLLEHLMAEGQLPHMRSLRDRGGYSRLATSMPPLSPVAWSNFITGMNPGGHGIFDFIHRNPETKLPFLSTSRTEPPSRTITLGSWVIPLSGGKVELLREGTAFWEVLEEHAVPTTILRIPANFPPVGSKSRVLSGMGTPDLWGTYGTFAFFTDDPEAQAEDVSGGKVYPVAIEGNTVRAELAGPKNTFKKGEPRSTVDFTVRLDPIQRLAKITVQDREILLKQGEWSPWVRLNFEMIPYLKSVTGICRFYLKEVNPQLGLYVTPVNMDPQAPALPISVPAGYSAELAEAVGDFYTQGMPEDTQALNAKVLNRDEFLAQARMVLKETEASMDYELARFRSGFLFVYFSTVDQVGHMFWQPVGGTSGPFPNRLEKRYRSVMKDFYKEIDRIVGKALKAVGEQGIVIVMSDHGFAPLYRQFHLNTWLKEQGYLRLQAGAKDEGDLFVDVDWQQSRAYGLGLNALYLNLRGRERTGFIEPGAEREALLDEIARKLLAVKDPLTGKTVVARLYRPEEIYTGPEVKSAPDLLVGYNRGYGASGATVLGKIPQAILEDNKKNWIGDHGMAAELVPGVVLANRKIVAATPALEDVTATILAEFGISKLPAMTGRSIFDSN